MEPAEDKTLERKAENQDDPKSSEADFYNKVDEEMHNNLVVRRLLSINEYEVQQYNPEDTITMEKHPTKNMYIITKK